tara:strand:- start:1369 stop:2142 length:774 start_codon:yes stop_codon:yes gene_type:complete
MNGMVSKIDEIIKYLTRVFNGVELTLESKKKKEKYGEYIKKDEIVRSQDFFILTKELDNVLEEWFVGFENKDVLNKALKFKLGEIMKLSFPKGKESFYIIKDLSNHNNLILSKDTHNNYSHLIHSHLIKVFEEKIGTKKVNEKSRITIKNKNIYNLLKQLNLELDFLKEESLPKDFVNVLIGTSDKNIHLNINNGSFHYLLTKLKSFFYTFSISAVARTNKIHGSKGTLLKVKNLLNSKASHPKHKDAIDRVFKKFE